MRDNEFKWDDRKAAANFRKHHVAFDFARSAFDDKKVFERLDTDETDEERFLATGLAGVRMLTICYTQRGPRKRIISAWKATRNEQNSYNEQNRDTIKSGAAKESP